MVDASIVVKVPPVMVLVEPDTTNLATELTELVMVRPPMELLEPQRVT